jgi:TRAP-type mannitol/chloroaromatic compound transport system permease small subunit
VESAARRLARRIDAWQDAFGRAVSWLMLVMVLVVFTDVIMRYSINRSFVAMQEAEWYLFGISYLLAGGYVMLYDEHVRVDILYSRWAPRTKAWVDLALLFVFFFPSCLLVIITTWPFFRNAYAVLEGSPDPGGIPLRWALKGVIIVGFVIMGIQGVSQAILANFCALPISTSFAGDQYVGMRHWNRGCAITFGALTAAAAPAATRVAPLTMNRLRPCMGCTSRGVELASAGGGRGCGSGPGKSSTTRCFYRLNEDEAPPVPAPGDACYPTPP